ncbi:glycosyltransferase [Novosphingobium pentaromativorans]|uniref:Glycosyltransferase n=1 Tax=Novosphingobium pentaromativorans US6-1 TaxID=1088721 RepID=G6EDL1_9SPHN|nr:glycosyltransferase [Novosphingobium pentaromativorans]AIT79715.1 group 1 glycosyl transferase [Novosphingobium pentaromativorans US6-1]EHJ60639.1 hypothetical protein NSU_2432 [Novosphingobium pentaromativorans US6-1]
MTKSLRIVVPIHSFEPGGVERVGLGLAKTWDDKGHAVTVVLGRDEGMDRNQAPSIRYRSITFPISTARFETIWMVWSLLVYLRHNKADVLFCPGNTYAIVCVAMRVLLGSRCPPVIAKISNDLVRADRPWLFRIGYRLWLRLQARFFARLVGMAEPMREEIACFMSARSEQIAVVPDPALELRRLQRLMAMQRERDLGPSVHFIAIGRLVPQKNFPLLIRAFAKAFRFGDRLTIVGDGPERACLENLVKKLAICDRVQFTGHLSSPDAWLKRADCLLLSSDYEGVPAVVLEAIAAGLPIIATECSMSMSELLGYGSRGVMVPVGDDEGFAAAIRDVLTLPRLGMKDRSFCMNFTLERGAEQYLSLMQTVQSGLSSEHAQALPVTPS